MAYSTTDEGILVARRRVRYTTVALWRVRVHRILRNLFHNPEEILVMHSSRRLIFLAILTSLVTLGQGSLRGAVQTNAGTTLYLPMVTVDYGGSAPDWSSPFGIQTYPGALAQPAVLTQAQQLGARWFRIKSVRWRQLQPNQGDPYNWSVLQGFEADILAANQAQLTPIVIVNDNPRWATIQPTSCGAIREDRFGDFAALMTALVQRYKGPPYNVHYWELGNEPDVDPSLVPIDSNDVDCWGNISDPYYGGEYYGKMIKAVAPSIKQADPSAKVLNGGLLLDRPNTTAPGYGHPEQFLEGMLRAGAAPYLDIVAYHVWMTYAGQTIDYNSPTNPWAAYGNPLKGKPAFLKEVMSRYDVSKPLFADEGGIGCYPSAAACNPPGPPYYEAEADHVARWMATSLNAGVGNMTWYTLQGPGWRYSGLLDANQQPLPAYRAYQQFIRQTQGAALPPQSVNYGSGLEGYRFSKSSAAVDIVWSNDTTMRSVTIPQAKFIGAYSRDGNVITPSFSNGNAVIPVGFSPVYIRSQP